MKDLDRALLKAVDELDVGAVRAALKDGADVHAYRNGRTLIGRCLDTTYPWPRLFDPRVAWIVRLLLQVGAEPDQPVDEGEEGTALHEVAMHGPYDVVEALLDAGANPNLRQDKETALDIAEFDYWYHSIKTTAEHDCSILARTDLPVLPMPDEETELEGAFECWTRWSQQQFIPLLRRRGACRSSELDARSVDGGLWVNADIRGGIATRGGMVKGEALARLSASLREAFTHWCESYVNPWVDGFDAARVASFDYDEHARAGLGLAQCLVEELKLAVPTYFVALSRAALDRRSHGTDALEWTPQHPVFVSLGSEQQAVVNSGDSRHPRIPNGELRE